MERLEFVRSRVKNAPLLLVGALLVFMCYYMAVSGDSLFDRAIGWFGVAFFGLASIIGLARVVRGGTVFSFDPGGVTDHANSIVMPWADIKECTLVSVQGAQFLAITFRNPDQFTSRLNVRQRLVSRLDEFMDCGHWALSFSGVSPDLNTALRFIRQHAPSVRAPRPDPQQR